MDHRDQTRFTAKEAADYLHLSPSTLAKWRMRGIGPAYHRVGKRIVYYIKTEISDWLHECDSLTPQPRNHR